MFGKKKIMIVEDDSDMISFLKTLFEKEGYKVMSASSGEECLAFLEKEKPDLIILDMMMTGMTGIDVANAINKNPKTKDIKIIFLSALSSEESDELVFDKFKATSAKFNALDYIKKPFSNEDILRKVKIALEL